MRVIAKRRSCVDKLAHAAERGDLDQEIGDNFVPENASSNSLSTRASRPTGPSLSLKFLPTIQPYSPMLQNFFLHNGGLV